MDLYKIDIWFFCEQLEKINNTESEMLPRAGWTFGWQLVARNNCYVIHLKLCSFFLLKNKICTYVVYFPFGSGLRKIALDFLRCDFFHKGKKKLQLVVCSCHCNFFQKLIWCSLKHNYNNKISRVDCGGTGGPRITLILGNWKYRAKWNHVNRGQF